VFRELLQNSDDAQSSAVEIHFETEEYLRRKNNKNAMQPGDSEGFPDLKTTLVRTISTLLQLSFLLIDHCRFPSGPFGITELCFAMRTGIGLGKLVCSAPEA
jgi:hypothetical protein